jgi:membrane-bound serine protease (ClpP class)
LVFILGIVLLLLEIFIIPGFGVAGISGILLIVVSLVLAMQDFVWPTFEWQWDILRRNLVLVLVSLSVSFVALLVIARLVPNVSLFRRIMLTSTQLTSDGYTAHEPAEEDHLIGSKGTVITTLRPVGKAEIGEEILVVEAEGEFLEPGRKVVVTEVQGNKIIVRET